MAPCRKYATRILGGFQCVMGALASTFAYVVYISASVQEELRIGQGEVGFFMFVFLVFGVFSVMSGMILMREKC